MFPPLPTLLLALASSNPAPALQARDEALAARIEAYVAPLVEAGHLSGSLLVARRGEVLAEASWGLANRELEVPIDLDSRFCIGAISATMTKALLAILVDEGALSPDDTVDKWIEGFPGGDKVTVAHLRDYKSGLPNQIFELEERMKSHTTADIVEAAKRHELMFEPGEQTFFSFGSYGVLTYVLEQASGRSYSELLREKIFEPAGMQHSAHVESGELLPRRASGYRVGPRAFLNAVHEDVSHLTGSSSVWSTPRDLFQFHRAVVSGELGAPLKASLALEIEFHWVGVFSCYRALADYTPEDGLFVAFAGNVRTGGIDLLRTALPRLVAGEELGPATLPPHEAIDVPVETLAEFVGRYAIPGNELEMRLVGTNLFLGDWILVPIEEDRFFSPMDYADVSVMRDEDGVLLGVGWTLNERTLGCRKIR